MKILIPIKRVADPDNANKVKASPDGAKVVTDGMEFKINPFDEYALEAALRLTENGQTKEKKGETVVVSIGPADTAATLRQAMAMGADRAILINGDDEQLDANVVAPILKAVVEKEKPDLVVMGKQAVDGDSAVVGPILAELLGWPMATFVMAIATEDAGKTFEIGREVDMGVLKVRIKGPAVLTASDRIIHPKSISNGVTPKDFAYPEAEGGRYASLKGIMAAKKKPIEQIDGKTLGVNATLTTKYTKFQLPPARTGKTTFVESPEELVRKLRTEAKVI